MESYAWPGNVRELRNIVERLAILCDQDHIEPHHLPEEIAKPPRERRSASFPTTGRSSSGSSSRSATRPSINSSGGSWSEALQRCEGNVSRAAEEIGIQRTNLHALMRKYGLN